MKKNNNLLQVKQLDFKLQKNSYLQSLVTPKEGWVNTIRKTLNMSLVQFANRLNITPQSARSIEQREQEGKITINSLSEAADALDMRLVYGLIPKGKSLEDIIENKAHELALKIVRRTSVTMRLEDQENSEERIKQAIEEMTAELKREMPKTLWD